MNTRRALWHAGGLAGVLLATLLTGCTQRKAAVKLPPTAQQEQDAFDEAANRPPTPKTMLAMAQLLSRQGKDSEAEYILRRIIHDNTNYVPAYCALAEVQMRQRRTDDAIRSLEGGLRISAGDPSLVNNLGMCWMVKGDSERALKLFTQAAGAMPDNARYRSNMAVALGLMGRNDEALALFQHVVPPQAAQANLAALVQSADAVPAEK